jgi:hypothetical protein
MQNTTWNIFSVTGNIDAYLLYKEFQRMQPQVEEELELSNEPTEMEGVLG